MFSGVKGEMRSTDPLRAYSDTLQNIAFIQKAIWMTEIGCIEKFSIPSQVIRLINILVIIGRVYYKTQGKQIKKVIMRHITLNH